MNKKTGSRAKQKMRDEGTCVFGAGVLLKYAQALRDEVSGVHAGEEDIEFIHRARVASRHLRASFLLFQDCLPEKKSAAWIKRIRKVTRALGEARDTDVQIERLEKFSSKVSEARFRPGINRLILRRRQRRQQLQPQVTRAMAKLLESEMIEEMIERFSNMAGRIDSVYIYTPALYQHSFQSINQRLENFLAFDEIVAQPEKVSELHEMRIHAKWLRYTTENFAPLYVSELKPYLQVIKKVQEALGDIHDCDVWGQFLSPFLEEERRRTADYFGNERRFKHLVPGILHFQQNRLETREKLYKDFVCNWQEWKNEMIWEALRKAIQAPYPQQDENFPSPTAPEPGKGKEKEQ